MYNLTYPDILSIINSNFDIIFKSKENALTMKTFLKNVYTQINNEYPYIYNYIIKKQMLKYQNSQIKLEKVNQILNVNVENKSNTKNTN